MRPTHVISGMLERLLAGRSTRAARVSAISAVVYPSKAGLGLRVVVQIEPTGIDDSLPLVISLASALISLQTVEAIGAKTIVYGNRLPAKGVTVALRAEEDDWRGCTAAFELHWAGSKRDRLDPPLLQLHKLLNDVGRRRRTATSPLPRISVGFEDLDGGPVMGGIVTEGESQSQAVLCSGGDLLVAAGRSIVLSRNAAASWPTDARQEAGYRVANAVNAVAEALSAEVNLAPVLASRTDVAPVGFGGIVIPHDAIVQMVGNEPRPRIGQPEFYIAHACWTGGVSLEGTRGLELATALSSVTSAVALGDHGLVRIARSKSRPLTRFATASSLAARIVDAPLFASRIWPVISRMLRDSWGSSLNTDVVVSTLRASGVSI